MRLYPTALVFVLALAMFSPLASAQQNIPHQFYGNVSVNGRIAPDSMLVVAKIDGADVMATVTLGSSYGYWPNTYCSFCIPNPNGDRGGEKIEFFVNGIKGGESTYTTSDTERTTELNLAITGGICGEGLCTSGESCSSCPADCGQCTPPGGGTTGGGGAVSGGGGGFAGSTNTANRTNTAGSNQAACTQNMTCTDWMDCVNGKQHRVCTDANRCTNATMTTEEKVCVQRIIAAACTNGANACIGDSLMVCNENTLNLVKTCASGCNSTTMTCNGEAVQNQPFGSGILGMITADSASIYGVVILIAALAGFFLWKKRAGKTGKAKSAVS